MMAARPIATVDVAAPTGRAMSADFVNVRPAGRATHRP